MFFESNNILNLKYLADSYQNTKSYDKALVHYSLIYNISENDSIKNEVIIEISQNRLGVTAVLNDKKLGLFILPANNTFLHLFFFSAIKILPSWPIPIDIEDDTFNLDVNLIEKKITKKTKAIMPVHLCGKMADMKQLMKLSKKYKAR